MSDADNKTPTPPTEPVSTQDKVKALESEIALLEKKCGSFSPEILTQLKAANAEFEAAQKRLLELATLLSGLSTSPSRESDLVLQARSIKEAAVSFFTLMKVNPDQWKNLGS